jgi:hypothetical protein
MLDGEQIDPLILNQLQPPSDSSMPALRREILTPGVP